MYIFVGMSIIGLVIALSGAGRKGRQNLINYWATRRVKLDDYDAEQKNLDKLMR